MSRNTGLTVACAVALGALGGGPVVAGQHDMHGTASMTYDRTTEKTISGTIQNIIEVPGTQAMSGIHLVLETRAGVFHVHAGPAAFLASKRAAFKKVTT